MHSVAHWRGRQSEALSQTDIRNDCVYPFVLTLARQGKQNSLSSLLFISLENFSFIKTEKCVVFSSLLTSVINQGLKLNLQSANFILNFLEEDAIVIEHPFDATLPFLKLK